MGQLIKRRDILTRHTAGITIRVYRDIGIALNVNYWERETNIYYGNRDWLFIGGSLVYDF